MEDLSDIRTLPLSSLTSTTRRLLSTLLDSTKVLPTEGPIRRHRDWRGLASLVNISSEVEASIWNHSDKTGKVLDLWTHSGAGTLGELLEHLITLDRFDVYDDVIASIREQPRIQTANQIALQGNNCNHIVPVDDPEVITFEDRPGHRHKYHAYMLNADEDKEFVMQMMRFLNSYGFEICTKDNLLPGYASQFPPVSKLITERCGRIILVYSNKFLESNENSFFRDYAQSDTIQKNQRRLVPIMYQQCELPPHLRPYHMLYHNSDNFWQRLLMTMETSRYLIQNGPSASAPPQQNSNSHSGVSISSMPESYSGYFLPSCPHKISPPVISQAPSNNLPTPSNVLPTPSNVLPTPSNVLPTPGNISQATIYGESDSRRILLSKSSEPQSPKKRGIIRRFFKTLTGKKDKKNKVQMMSPAQQICA